MHNAKHRKLLVLPLFFICQKSRRPKKQPSGNKLLSALETYLKLEEGTIKVYVLVEQLEATFQLMETGAKPLACTLSVLTPAAGITLTAFPTPFLLGYEFYQPQHRSHYHDLWLHAPLRRPGAPGCEYAG